jgi:hypothetical protein
MFTGLFNRVVVLVVTERGSVPTEARHAHALFKKPAFFVIDVGVIS